jgi:hypothetical protein
VLTRFRDVTGQQPLLGKTFDHWFQIEFSEFRTALRNKFKVDIPVSERDQWEMYFNARKAEVIALSTRIADLEAEINERVYRLFDLSLDEIALIEEAIAGQY